MALYRAGKLGRETITYRDGTTAWGYVMHDDADDE